MPDEEKVETTDTDPKDETTEDQKKEQDKGDGKTPEQLRAELASANARIGVLNKESTERRKKLEKYESDEKKRGEAGMSEIEKANNRLAELESGIQQRDAALRTTRIQTAVERTASKLKFRDPEDAYTMLLPKQADIEIDENGVVKGVEELLKQLAKSKPYLIDEGDGSKSPNIDAKTDSKQKAEHEEEELRSRYF